ncbi:(d)CMP kinase [Endozoicomonas sp. SM1973]|uniref:Cytidylate kinase n=1 Tax=Spartinivicinus marinus TaxID=2994442 RepID=A0A853I7D4_9GAMM|nr:(d)CMP kinase [Spartinivicinus marinus]MCX4028789.1 (d)CMP kinase [Spartinivicinus marinus]NYZ67602.1 (d)CMP kinase [Spartinivicinus marinus]
MADLYFTKVPVITIDGPSGSGKGTVASLLANQLGWHLLDSGSLYRLTALAAQIHGVDLADEDNLKVLAAHLDVQFVAATETESAKIILEGERVERAIRAEDISLLASQVAALTQVRQALLERQRAFAEAPGLVADGRDMGTVVFPKAPLKIYLTASAEVRAERRFRQLKESGFSANIDQILEDICARDERDMKRATAPLKPAEDAIIIDTSRLTITEVVTKVMAEVEARGL